MNTKHLPLIILLMLITGLLIYYLYMKPENFIVPVDAAVTPPGCPPVPVAIPLSIISRFFGVGFNIYPANNTNQLTLPDNISSTKLFLIEHIPVVYNNTLGSMYSISTDGQLTIKLRNDQDVSQWWSLTTKTETDNTTTYYTMIPYTLINMTPQSALQYENGNLALRPYNNSNPFESQKWITSPNKITRGIPVLNYNPASLFTPEFDPYSSTDSVSSSSLSQQNNQQVADVIKAIRTNIQQYLTQVSGTNQNIPQTSSSSLGNKSMPLNINLNLGNGVNDVVSSIAGGSGSATGGSTLSAFANINGTTTQNDILSLLDKYENTGTPASSLYSINDLQTALSTNGGCSKFNINDYTSNRVGSCNCKL